MKARVVGVISDTHGLLRPEARDALAGADHIIHAGDIGSLSIVRELERIAPLTAIRGNNDREAWAYAIPETAAVTLGGHVIYVLHNLSELSLDLEARQVEVVISGHSHKPTVHQSEGVLYLNPGSAGPRRFSLPITVANLFLSADTVRAEIVELAADAAKTARNHRTRKR